VTHVLLPANDLDSFAISGLRLSRFRESRYKAFGSPTHETTNWLMKSDLCVASMPPFHSHMDGPDLLMISPFATSRILR
jgi:hypothetical protein